jgi:DNA transposition AAA+ family ATPase
MKTPASSSSAVYSADDIESIAAVEKWLADHNQTKAWLSRKTAIPNGTLSQILSKKYVSSPTQQLLRMAEVLAVEAERLKDGTPGYVKGSVHKLMEVVCDRTRKHQNFGVFTGHVGVGKTTFCKEYRAAHQMTVLIESSPNMTPGVLLCDMLAQLNHAAPPGLDRKFREIVRVLAGTNYIVIVDEAEKISSVAMEYLRRIRDIARVGVVLVGTEKLSLLLKPLHGQFDQVRSRVGMWPKTVERITRDDADAIARRALPEAGELNDDVLDVLWAYSLGSARVLSEALVPAIRDYGLRTTAALSADTVHQVAAKVLFLDKPTQGAKA